MEKQIRPFKLWNGERSIKKSLTASSMHDVIEIGKRKLGYRDCGVSLVLESDGTVVDNEDYFQTLEDNTTFLLLTASEVYSKPWEVNASGLDETDFTLSGTRKTLSEIIHTMTSNWSQLATLSEDDCEVLVTSDHNQVQSLLKCSEQQAKQLQEAAQRHLDEKRDVRDALAVVQLLRSETVEHESKRKKAANS